MDILKRRLFLKSSLSLLFITLVATIIPVQYSCAKDPLLSVYLTFPEIDTSRSIRIHFITKEPLANPIIAFGESAVWNQLEYPAELKTLADVPRWYYSAKVDNLNPNSVYYFKINGLTNEYKFRTLPDDNSTIKIIQGGDMGTEPIIAEISKDAMLAEPHVIMIGGDIAYANGNINNYDKWDEWFSVMNEAMTTPSGFLVPLIVAIGNHEVNTLRFGSKIDRAPFYFTQFDQSEGDSYFKRRLGAHTMLFVLDTGHATSHMGGQRAWIEKNLKSDMNIKNRMALYHIPLYPSVRKYTNMLSSGLRTAWRPLFDQYKLTMAFENHDHALKRTKLLYQNKPVEKNGTLYLGDGCWGRSERPVDTARPYLEFAESVKHVWYGELSLEELSFTATGVHGEVFDQVKITH